MRERTSGQYFLAAAKVFTAGIIIALLGFALQGLMDYPEKANGLPGDPIPWMAWMIWPSWTLMIIGGLVTVFGTLFFVGCGVDRRSVE